MSTLTPAPVLRAYVSMRFDLCGLESCCWAGHLRWSLVDVGCDCQKLGLFEFGVWKCYTIFFLRFRDILVLVRNYLFQGYTNGIVYRSLKIFPDPHIPTQKIILFNSIIFHMTHNLTSRVIPVNADYFWSFFSFFFFDFRFTDENRLCSPHVLHDLKECWTHSEYAFGRMLQQTRSYLYQCAGDKVCRVELLGQQMCLKLTVITKMLGGGRINIYIVPPQD